MTQPAFDIPLEVTPVDGEVVITGPDGLRGSLTPRAARRSAQRLIAAADVIERANDCEDLP